MSDVNAWETVCSVSDIQPGLGVRALLGDQQVAVFNVLNKWYAIDAIDPFTQAAVLSRGIVGSLQGQTVVASPIYKQHFNLETGQCLEDENVSVKVFPVREEAGELKVALS